MIKLSIVIPVYNEEATLPELISRLDQLTQSLETQALLSTSELEIVLTNDGSRDNSLSILIAHAQSRPHFRVVNLARNYGHQIASTAGLETAVGDAVVIMDADLQDPPEVILELYKTYLQGYDVVYATRAKRLGESVFKKGTAFLYYKLLNALTGGGLPQATGDFRLMSRRVVEAFKQMREHRRLIRAMVHWVGFKQTGVLYTRDQRFAGKTNYSLSKMIALAIDGITGFSAFPLRMIFNLGILTSCLAFCYSFYALYEKFFTGKTVSGWTSLVLVVLYLGGVQLIALGVIAEYISCIHTETKNRPLYFIEKIYSNGNVLCD